MSDPRKAAENKISDLNSGLAIVLECDFFETGKKIKRLQSNQ